VRDGGRRTGDRRGVRVVNDTVTGVRADVLSSPALAGALVRLLDRSSERQQVARQAEAWVRDNASLESVAQRFISLYRMLAEERVDRGNRIAS